MARTKVVATSFGGETVSLTPSEETARDAEEAVWEEERPARAMTKLRMERNALLASSDWTQASDSPLNDGAKSEWAVHRQLLRDLPATESDPADPTWPEAPE